MTLTMRENDRLKRALYDISSVISRELGDEGELEPEPQRVFDVLATEPTGREEMLSALRKIHMAVDDVCVDGVGDWHEEVCKALESVDPIYFPTFITR
jgi:hypothetical protein